jgi:hypothetical protein
MLLSAIFDNFRRKNWGFSQKPMLRSKFCICNTALLFFLGENIFKIVTSVPGRPVRRRDFFFRKAVAATLTAADG